MLCIFNINNFLQSTIEKSLIFNDCTETNKINKAIEYLQRTIPSKESESSIIVNNIIENNTPLNKESPEGLTKLILENKFLDLKWEIVFDDSSNKTANISQIKIHVKIIYLNLLTMKKECLFFILSEKEFSDLLIEIQSLQKNFQFQI